jgi:hypothetical protein
MIRWDDNQVLSIARLARQTCLESMERMTILHSFFRNFAVVLVVAGFGLTMTKLPINPC